MPYSISQGGVNTLGSTFPPMTRVIFPGDAMSAHFLCFPAEIRLQIYNWLLVSTQPINLLHLSSRFRRYLPTQKLGLAVEVLRVAKSVTAEALPLLYQKNSFYLEVSVDVNDALFAHELRRSHLAPCLLRKSRERPSAGDLAILDCRYTYLITNANICLTHTYIGHPHAINFNAVRQDPFQRAMAALAQLKQVKKIVIRVPALAKVEVWLLAAGNSIGLANGMALLMEEYYLESAHRLSSALTEKDFHVSIE